MIDRALRYPIAGGDLTAIAAGTASLLGVALGLRYAAALSPTVLALVPTAVAAFALVVGLGYLSGILVSDEETPPTPPFRSLVRQGAAALVVSAGYLLAPVLVLVVTVEGARRTDGVSNGAEALFTFTGSTVTLIVALSFVYAVPSALAAVRRSGRLRSAVDAAAVGSVLREVDYLFGWVVGATVVALGLVLATITLGAGGVAGLAAAPAAAYLVLAGTRRIAIGYARALGRS